MKKSKYQKRRAKVDNPQGPQPKFIIKIGGGYYSSERAWQESTRDQATRMTHFDARRNCGRLHRLGYKNAEIEPE